MDLSNQTKDGNNLIIFFDDTCNLCNRFVLLIIWLDKKRVIRFSNLSSQFAKQFPELKAYLLPPYQTVIVYSNQKVFTKSDALIEISNHLNYPWKIFSIIRFIPKKFRDSIYAFIADNRYRFFGKEAKCTVHQEDFKELFLN